MNVYKHAKTFFCYNDCSIIKKCLKSKNTAFLANHTLNAVIDVNNAQFFATTILGYYHSNLAMHEQV